jgi:hypothetical protein
MTSKQTLAATSTFGRSRFTPRSLGSRGGKAVTIGNPPLFHHKLLYGTLRAPCKNFR